MKQLWRPLLVRLICCVSFVSTSSFELAAQTSGESKPITDEDAEKQNIEVAATLSREAARKYEFEMAGKTGKVELHVPPILRWSNPERGQVYGHVFLWTNQGRPVAVGSLFKWFSPHTHSSHEFHSLSRDILTGRYDTKNVWQASHPGVAFAAIPDAASVAMTPAGRLTQMKQLARQFTARSIDRDGQKLELRQLAQPVYRYQLEQDSTGVLDGALFVFVQGTDPEVWLMLEAISGEKPSDSKWHFALARMNSIEFAVEHNGRPIWRCDVLPFKDVGAHKLPYTSFGFDKR